MRLGVLFSGGKDSAFACNLAGMRDDVVCLITIASRVRVVFPFLHPI